jgi:hypothetical protein
MYSCFQDMKPPPPLPVQGENVATRSAPHSQWTPQGHSSAGKYVIEVTPVGDRKIRPVPFLCHVNELPGYIALGNGEQMCGSFDDVNPPSTPVQGQHRTVITPPSCRPGSRSSDSEGTKMTTCCHPETDAPRLCPGKKRVYDDPFKLVAPRDDLPLHPLQ